MKLGSGRYDAELHMFADSPREPSLAQLRFMRWLAERGRLEHETAGAPGGEYAVDRRYEQPAAA